MIRRAGNGPKRQTPKSVSSFGNEWQGVVEAEEADVEALDRVAGVALPEALRALLFTCGGGVPARAYYAGPGCEVLDIGVGYVLPLKKTRRIDDLATVWSRLRAHPGWDARLAPFAFDVGHANPICVDLATGTVHYWLHDESDRVRFVAPTLETFLAGLGPCPF